jgi:hypothetical protein
MSSCASSGRFGLVPSESADLRDPEPAPASDARPVRAVSSAGEPWLGPDHYTEELHELFRGRAQESQMLRRLIKREQLSVLFGASGLGKTSLILAGLFPLLRQEHFLPVYVRLKHVESAPPLGEQVLRALEAAAQEAEIEAPVLEERDLLWQFFHRRDARYWSRDHRVVTPVIVLDQFEEIFTRGQQNAACTERSKSFLLELADVIEDRLPKVLETELERTGKDAVSAGYRLERPVLKVLLSLREDFLAPLEQLRETMPSLIRNRMRLTPFSVEQATQAVSEPAKMYGLLTEGVTDGIVRYISGAREDNRARLPSSAAAIVPAPRGVSTSAPTAPAPDDTREIDPALLSIFCYELNRRRIEAKRNKLSPELLAGHQEEILSGFYARAFEGLPSFVRTFVEDRLVTLTGYRDSRPIDEIRNVSGLTKDHLDVLVKRRLIHYEEARRQEPQRVELKHDVFLRVARQSRQQRLDLIERTKQRNRALRRFVWVIVGLGVVLVVLGAGFWYFALVREHVAHFANVSSVRGEPLGIGRLSGASVSSRPWSLRIVRRGYFGRVLRMEAIDGRGQLTTRHEIGNYLAHARDRLITERLKEVAWRYIYDDRQALVSTTAYDRDGKPAWTFVYASSEVDPATGDAVRVGHFVGRRGFPEVQMQHFVQLRFDVKTGFNTEIRYLDGAQRPVIGRDGAYGVRMGYDARGSLLSETSLSAEGNPMSGKNGSAIREYVRDSLGNITSTDYRDAKHEPTHVAAGYFRLQQEWDQHGNLVAVDYRDAAGQPRPSRDGYHREEYTLSSEGLNVRAVFLDRERRPTHDRNGCFGYRRRYDETFATIESVCLDAQQAPLVGKDGYATAKSIYDAWGAQMEESYFDRDGAPVSVSGSHRLTIGRDEQGRVVELKHHSPSGARVLRSAPTDSDVPEHSRVTYEFRDDANQTIERYFAQDDQRVTAEVGYSGIERSYDEHGALIQVRFLDARDQPIRISSAEERERLGFVWGNVGTNFGYAGYRITRAGASQRFAYFDVDGTGERYFQMRNDFDEFGNIVLQKYETVDGQGAVDPDGSSGYRAEFDAWGNRTKHAYLGANDELHEDSDGVALFLHAYDDWGNSTKSETFDAKEKLTNDRFGVARTMREFDDWGRVLVEHQFDADGEPTECARWVWSYTEDGSDSISQRECFAADSQPALGRDAESRYARRRTVEDSQGRLKSAAFYDTEGWPRPQGDGCPGHQYTYDGLGNITDWACAVGNDRFTMSAAFGLSPVRHEVHRVTRTFAGRRLLSEASYDELGNLTPGAAGIAKMVYEYAQPSSLSLSQFDPNDALLSTTERVFNGRNQLLQERRLDAKGEPIVSDGAAPRLEFEYDAVGYRRLTRAFDHADRLLYEIRSTFIHGREVTTLECQPFERKGQAQARRADARRPTPALRRCKRTDYDVFGNPLSSQEFIETPGNDTELVRPSNASLVPEQAGDGLIVPSHSRRDSPGLP